MDKPVACLITGTSNPSTFTATPGPCGGTVTETWTATDACGRALASVSKNNHGYPAALPTMTAPGAITVACGVIPAASHNTLYKWTKWYLSDQRNFKSINIQCNTWSLWWNGYRNMDSNRCLRKTRLHAVSRTITVDPAPLPTMTAPGAITVACGAIPAASTIPYTNGVTGRCLITGTSNPSTFSATPVLVVERLQKHGLRQMHAEERLLLYPERSLLILLHCQQ